MKELQRRQMIKRLLYSIPSLLLVSTLAFLIVKGAVEVVIKERESARMVRELEEKNASLEVREEELKKDIARLETEEGVVEEIKGRFRVAEEGEYVAIIMEERVKTALPEEETGLARFKNWWRNLWSK